MTAPSTLVAPQGHGGRALTAPFFEIGPKNLLRLPAILDVARAAGEAGDRHGVSVILTVPAPLIAAVAAARTGVFVFAQTMDADDLGPSVGTITAEALVDAGADGTMLNHESSPLGADALRRTVTRAHDAGLLTMVCAGSDDQVLATAALDPTIILYEPPALIGHAGGTARPWIGAIDTQMRTAAPDVLMMHAGGVGSPADVRDIMAAGASGTGSTSGVLRAASPTRAAAEFIAAARAGYDAHRH